ncbi:hypothetical protein NQ314_002900 [Rhamnusium bicolor]|uniref:Protein CDV3 homolog n=1 Tax=Rhamnusium bicolor TaxID=1586634 RepID=A0AAV8ZNU4_9CUCU|nr:hypothetical protein NQ314_002900 [Rhamnusium bicolor]
MADLDDFFAKKDLQRRLKKVKKERAPEGEDSSAPVHEQDEWKDFEEEKKDYSGLKIGNLTIGSNAEGSTGPKETNTEQQQEDESGQETEKKVGPWKRIDANEVQEEPRVEKKVEAPSPNVVKGAYVPPSLRSSGPTQVQPNRLKSKAAPDIHNEEYFPTLSKTSDYKKNRNEGSFEVVQHNRSSSHRQAEQSKYNSTQGPKLNLGNRYNTLSNDS